MRQLSSTGFNKECFEVFCTGSIQLFLWKTQASENPRSVRKMMFPFLDLKNVLIDIPLPLPFPAPVKPMIRIEMLRGNSNHDGHDTEVDDEPSNEINGYRPDRGEKDESHESNFSRSQS